MMNSVVNALFSVLLVAPTANLYQVFHAERLTLTPSLSVWQQSAAAVKEKFAEGDTALGIHKELLSFGRNKPHLTSCNHRL